MKLKKTCVICDKSGIFLSVDNKNVCNACANIHYPIISRHCQIIEESISIVKKSKKLDTILSRYGVAENYCLALIPYYKKGVFNSFAPEEMIAAIANDKKSAVSQQIQALLIELKSRSDVTDDAMKKSKLVEKTIHKIADMQINCAFFDFTMTLQNLMHLQCNFYCLSFIEKGEKLQAQGKLKQSLSCFHQARYELENDRVPDSEQQSLKSKIDGAISTIENILS